MIRDLLIWAGRNMFNDSPQIRLESRVNL